MFMQSTQGMLICLGIPFALYILYDIFKRRKDSRKENEALQDQLKEKERLEAELAKLKAEKQQIEETE